MTELDSTIAVNCLASDTRVSFMWYFSGSHTQHDFNFSDVDSRLSNNKSHFAEARYESSGNYRATYTIDLYR